ncbi:MAG: branched-chain-amino-acid transaminase [Candidatus Omnitrophota bacterium]
MEIFLNGKFVAKEDAKVSVFDHGFLYGDGGFEGIRSYDRCVFRLQEHIDRLYETLHTLMIASPMSKQEMIEAVVQTLKRNNLDNGYIRLIVTRGVGDLGLDPKKCYGTPGVIIIADKIVLYPKEFYEKGMAIMTVPTSRNHPEALNPQLKSLNYLNNILAKIEAGNGGFSEAIMLDISGYVAECTGDNIFIVKKGELFTPMEGRLQGITRDAVIQLAGESGIPVTETWITRHEVYNADECFLTGTAAEIVPIVKVDGRQIGTGEPGNITRKLLEKFQVIIKNDGVCY